MSKVLPMLSFMSLEQIKNDVSHFINYVEPDCNVTNLRSDYFKCLNKVQKNQFQYHSDSSFPTIIFDVENLEFIPIFNYASPNISIEESYIPKEERYLILDKMNLAYQKLTEYKSSLNEVISQLVGSYLIARYKGFGGASFSDTLGFVWLSPPKFWTEVDFAESILHESVHQGLYLCEMVKGMFNLTFPEMQAEETWAISAVRKTKRPYSLAFHSACVSISIIEFYGSSPQFVG